MTTKVWALPLRRLNWAVAKAAGLLDLDVQVWEEASKAIVLQPATGLCFSLVTGRLWHPVTNWEQGGSLIDLKKICISVGHDGIWIACSRQNYGDRAEAMHSGGTALEAAMRTFVELMLGVEIEIPKELP